MSKNEEPHVPLSDHDLNYLIVEAKEERRRDFDDMS